MKRAKNVAIITGITVLLLIVLASAYLLFSPLSYFYVAFKEPLSAKEAVNFLKDYKIDPKNHMVAVDGSTLQGYDSIYVIDLGELNGKRVAHSMVFNTRCYALKAIRDSRVKSWSIEGPRHPYD